MQALLIFFYYYSIIFVLRLSYSVTFIVLYCTYSISFLLLFHHIIYCSLELYSSSFFFCACVYDSPHSFVGFFRIEGNPTGFWLELRFPSDNRASMAESRLFCFRKKRRKKKKKIPRCISSLRVPYSYRKSSTLGLTVQPFRSVFIGNYIVIKSYILWGWMKGRGVEGWGGG